LGTIIQTKNLLFPAGFFIFAPMIRYGRKQARETLFHALGQLMPR